MSFASKRLQDSAQGFNPGNHPPVRRALKGRQDFPQWKIVSLTNKFPISYFLFSSIRSAFGLRDLSPFQGEPLDWMFPRVETLG
jgi:hypothetical protein